ncbi:Rdx family-domain-containing protein [Sporodiniella umbellata]|nr:Rdx family-domain-containing protein [Sporodiniella umbellata]
MQRKFRIAIEYCPKCRWMMRAAWTAQELLTTFENEIEELALIPSDVGVFKVIADKTVVWDRKERGCFPELKDLKQLVRDVIAPEKALGHSDKKKTDLVAKECTNCPQN